MKNIMFCWLLIMGVFISCTTAEITPATGSLDVSVSIGPLCPVEPCNLTTEKIQAVYEAYSIIVTDVNSKKVTLQQKVSYNGTKGAFKALSVPVGSYELDISPKNIFTGKGFPKAFTIEKDKTTVLELSIDTGLR